MCASKFCDPLLPNKDRCCVAFMIESRGVLYLCDGRNEDRTEYCRVVDIVGVGLGVMKVVAQRSLEVTIPTSAIVFQYGNGHDLPVEKGLKSPWLRLVPAPKDGLKDAIGIWRRQSGICTD